MKAPHRKLAPLALSATVVLFLCLPSVAHAQADDTQVTKEPQEADIYPGLRGNAVDEQTVRDMHIKSQIDDAIAGEDSLDASSIEVKVENGVVSLSGTVRDNDARDLAERIAKGTQYVSKVKNELQITATE